MPAIHTVPHFAPTSIFAFAKKFVRSPVFVSPSTGFGVGSEQALQQGLLRGLQYSEMADKCNARFAYCVGPGGRSRASLTPLEAFVRGEGCIKILWSFGRRRPVQGRFGEK